VQLSGLQAPFTLALSPQDGSVWVCDLGGSLRHYDSDGSPGTPGSIGLLDGPEGVAVSPRDFSVWVCERAGNRVRHFSSVGTPLGSTDLPSPSRVAVDSLANVTWVTSFSRARIWRLSAGGAVLDSSSDALGPVGLAVDRVRGRAWVADPAGDRVLALDPSTLAVLFTVPGLPGAWDVAVDPGSGEVWVTVRDLGAVVRLSPNGAILDVCGGLSDPIEVRLDPGQ
jgi:DNA-binding beta-propeller fold protein YncE